MENTKQTAIDWLISMHFGGIEHVTPYFKKHIEEAKEMEKEQILDAYWEGGQDNPMTEEKGETYYQITYGGNI
jgi:hypothetical protein